MSRRPFRSRCQRVGQVVVSLTLATFTMGFLGVWPAQTLAADSLDRTVLPIPEPKLASITELDARNVKAPPRFEVNAPSDAPNVVIVLIDDIGFGHSSAFGGPIHMPTLEKMAGNGLKYNRSTPPRCVVPRAWPCSLAATITLTTSGPSWSWPRVSPAIPACGLRA